MRGNLQKSSFAAQAGAEHRFLDRFRFWSRFFVFHSSSRLALQARALAGVPGNIARSLPNIPIRKDVLLYVVPEEDYILRIIQVRLAQSIVGCESMCTCDRAGASTNQSELLRFCVLARSHVCTAGHTCSTHVYQVYLTGSTVFRMQNRFFYVVTAESTAGCSRFWSVRT